jgi:hypothetical protein
MAKAQTDIRTTSFDVRNANGFGYFGTIEDALAQIRAEQDHGSDPTYTRYELQSFLGVHKILSAGPSVELDKDVWYGEPDVTAPKQLGVNDPGFYGLAHANSRGWIK